MCSSDLQALHERQPWPTSLIHHSVRGVQYVSIKYTERLAEAGIEPSVGSVGDSYDNALAETVIGLFKTEVIHRRGPWRSFEAVEFATLEWVDGLFNRFTPVKAGSTFGVGSSPSAPSRPPRRKPPTTLSLRSCRWPRRIQANQPPENSARFSPGVAGELVRR